MFFLLILFAPLFGPVVPLQREPTPFEKQDETDSPQQSLQDRFADMKTASVGQNADIGELHMGDTIITASKSRWLFGPPQAATPDIENRWTDAMIPYEIDCSLENLPAAVSSINNAMAEWEKKTCIRFVKRTNEEIYLNIYRSTHCWAYAGKVRGSALSVGYGCEYDYVMAHELGHVIGFFHEQNRNDRDNWVTVNWGNIGKFEYAFEKAKNGIYHNTPYDYSSIMHYPWSAFSSNGEDTLTPKRRRKKIPPYVSVSRLDALQTSRMYNCPAVERKRSAQLKSIGKLIEMEKNAPSRMMSPPHHPTISEPLVILLMNRGKVNTARAPVGTKGCVDWSEHCQSWKKANYCKMYKVVREYCKETCDDPVCTDRCNTKDIYPVCKEFAKDGLCCRKEYKSFLKIHCCASCKAIRRKNVITPAPRTTTAATTTTTTTTTTKKPPINPSKPIRRFLGTGILCADAKDKCPGWAEQGECKKNPVYMNTYCSKSCKSKGCDLPGTKPKGTCTNPLGLAWDGTNNFKLPDSAFSSARGSLASGGWKASAANARLYYRDDRDAKRIGAWCSPTSKVTLKTLQSITVDLGVKKRITYIATQGRDKYFERVSKFKVEYSDDGKNFKEYTEKGVEKIFVGNCDHVTPVLNYFAEPLITRYFKYIPWRWNYPCVRMELYGCDLSDPQPGTIVSHGSMAESEVMCD